jgi:hypothetical protein
MQVFKPQLRFLFLYDNQLQWANNSYQSILLNIRTLFMVIFVHCIFIPALIPKYTVS